MSNKTRILVLTSTFPRWQGDNEPPFVLELCRRLAERFDVMVLAPHAPDARLTENIGNLEVHRFRYFITRWQSLAYHGGIMANLKQSRLRYLLIPFFIFFELVNLISLLRKYKFDAIHAHWLIPQGLTVALVGVFIKNMPPMICTSHGGDLLGLNGRLLSRIKRWVIRCSARITVVSNTMADCALALGARQEQLQTVSMGVDTRRLFTPYPATRRADNEILFVGRLVEKKGCTYLLEALSEILRQHPDTCLRVVGSGPEQAALKQQAHHLGIAHAVTFHGAVNNVEIPELYRRATIFVAPSIVTAQGDQEGLGLVLVEALACECPVVASDLPAFRDVVVDGVSGLVCKQKDSADLAHKVIALLDDAALRQTLGRAGRQYVSERFDWQIVAERYIRLINDVAARP